MFKFQNHPKKHHCSQPKTTFRKKKSHLWFPLPLRQNFIRDLDYQNRYSEYPKIQRLIKLKETWLRVKLGTLDVLDLFYASIWVFPKIGVPQNRWFTMENPIKMDDLGVPLFSETSIYSAKNPARLQALACMAKSLAQSKGFSKWSHLEHLAGCFMQGLRGLYYCYHYDLWNPWHTFTTRTKLNY